MEKEISHSALSRAGRPAENRLSNHGAKTNVAPKARTKCGSNVPLIREIGKE